MKTWNKLSKNNHYSIIINHSIYCLIFCRVPVGRKVFFLFRSDGMIRLLYIVVCSILRDAPQ